MTRKQLLYVSYLNRGFPNKDEILDVATYIESLGFVFARLELTQASEGEPYFLGYRISVFEEVERSFRESESPDETLPLIHQFGPVSAGFQAFLPVYTLAPQEDLPIKDFGKNPRFDSAFRMSGTKYNEINFILGRYEYETELLHSLSEVLFQIAKEYYRRYQPVYAWFNFAPTIERTALEPILDFEFHELYWVNIFGPEYVEKYGKSFFLNAPVWKTEELADGGILVQLSPNLMGTSIDLDLQILSQYFYPVGVRVLAWPKLVLFTGPGQVEKPFEDMDF